MFHIGWIARETEEFPVSLSVSGIKYAFSERRSLCNGVRSFYVVARDVVFYGDLDTVYINVTFEKRSKRLLLSLPSVADSSLMTMFDLCPWFQGTQCFGGRENVEAISARISQLSSRGEHPLTPRGVRGYVLGGNIGFDWPNAQRVIDWIENNFTDPEAKCCKGEARLSGAPVYVVLGNHDYDRTGCSSNVCTERMASAAEYLKIGLSAGVKDLRTLPGDVCECDDPACDTASMYGGSSQPVSWRESFGAYVHGAVGIITWDGRWDLRALLSSKG
jgi:hypothetical protein